MFELIFLKILLQLSIFSLQTVPKCYSSNFQEQKDFDRKSCKATITENPLFCYTANPSKCQICKGSVYEIKLTLLCETITYFIFNHLLAQNFKIVNPYCLAGHYVSGDSFLRNFQQVTQSIVNNFQCQTKHVLCVRQVRMYIPLFVPTSRYQKHQIHTLNCQIIVAPQLSIALGILSKISNSSHPNNSSPCKTSKSIP